jgi:HIRAN domain
MVNA